MKDGIKSTEFWLTLVSTVVSGLLASNVIPTDNPIYKVAGVVMAVLTSLGYTAARTVIKLNRNNKPIEEPIDPT